MASGPLAVALAVEGNCRPVARIEPLPSLRTPASPAGRRGLPPASACRPFYQVAIIFDLGKKNVAWVIGCQVFGDSFKPADLAG